MIASFNVQTWIGKAQGIFRALGHFVIITLGCPINTAVVTNFRLADYLLGSIFDLCLQLSNSISLPAEENGRKIRMFPTRYKSSEAETVEHRSSDAISAQPLGDNPPSRNAENIPCFACSGIWPASIRTMR
jgi:hypothetical protein